MEHVEGDPLDSLEDDLNAWRKTPFDRLVARRVPLHGLAEAVKRHRGDQDGGVRAEDIRSLLVAATAAAESPTTDSADGGYVSNPAVVREIFGLTARSKNASVENRQRHAAETIGHNKSWHTLRKDLGAFVRQLEGWLRRYLDHQSQSAEVSYAEQVELLIRRDDELAWLRTTYRDLLGQGGGIFQLWGLAGVGKTTLAMQLAEHIGPNSLTGTVRVGRRGLVETDLRRVLRLEGNEEDAWTDEYCFARFRTAVQRLRRIRLLILDDVATPEQVTELIPGGANIPVLITSRERMYLQAGTGTPPPALRIRTFSYAQCDQYLRTQLPNLRSDTTRMLATAAGGHPETLAHIARYLSQDDAMPVGELLEELHRQPRQTLVDLTEELGVPQSSVIAIGKLLKQLDRSSLAYAILLCLIWAEDLGQLPKGFVLEHVATLQNEQPSPLAIRAALAQLERLGLVSEANTSLVTSRITCQILRDLTIDDFEPVLLAYEKLISKPSVKRSRNDLQNVLRREYGYTKKLHEEWVRMTGNENSPPPLFVCVDERTWAYFATSNQGQRRVSLYRNNLQSIQHLSPISKKWIALSKEKLRPILYAVGLYYDAAGEGYLAERVVRGDHTALSDPHPESKEQIIES